MAASEPANSDSVRATRIASVEVIPRTSASLSLHQSHESRQLSDIAEASFSSRYSNQKDVRSMKTQNDGATGEIHNTPESEHAPNSTSPEFVTPVDLQPRHGHTRWMSHAASAISLPLCEIPARRSSISNLNLPGTFSRRPSLHQDPVCKPEQREMSDCIHSNDKRAESPIRDSLARGIQSSEASRRSPSRTFIRTSPAMDVLENGMVQHPRFQISTRLPSPLFVGGSTVEGQLEIKCDQTSKRSKLQPMYISKLSVDVFGIEEVSDDKRNVFLALANELFDAQHPPPRVLVTTQEPVKGSELLWETQPAQTMVPFCINLPLNLGPPPYASKGANIKYLLCPSATIKIGHKRLVVRHILHCQMLTVHDPEKALGSLPSPLIATDNLTLAQSPGQTIKLTAGLHRQTWINGSVLFIDIHVVNNSTKCLKRIDVQLEKSTLFYAHAAAGTAEKSASHLRLPKRNETEVASSMVIKKSSHWRGVLPQSSEVRTCELDIPRGYVTIGGGRYFEVRYFVRVLVSVNMFKTLAVQLPVTIIHMNSLDILPNALSQVAASIEAKRARTVPVSYDGPVPLLYCQGQAFEAPRRQSLERNHDGGNSFVATQPHSCLIADDMLDRNISNTKVAGRRGRHHLNAPSIASHHHHERHPSCYHCHIADCELERPRSSTYMGPKLPRLQVSTSGLGFSESEFEIPPDSPPKKVMLSESERMMIRQQRELKLQRQWSQRKANVENTNLAANRKGNATSFTGYWNVAANPSSNIPNEIGQRLSMPFTKNMGGGVMEKPRALANVTTPNRKRSKTNPEVIKPMYRYPNMAPPGRSDMRRGRKEVRSMDRGHRLFRASSVADDGDVFYDVKASQPPNRPGRNVTMYGPRA